MRATFKIITLLLKLHILVHLIPMGGCSSGPRDGTSSTEPRGISLRSEESSEACVCITIHQSIKRIEHQ